MKRRNANANMIQKERRKFAFVKRKGKSVEEPNLGVYDFERHTEH